MGGGPDKEHVVIILSDPEPEHITALLKRQFPYFDITYYQVSREGNGPKSKNLGSQVPDALWKSATILLTLFALPPKPELVPNLKLIHLFSAGVDHWSNHPIVKDSEITITTSSGIHGPPITEWIIMTTLVASRHYALEYEWQKQHHWGQADRMKLTGTDWVGKTVGIAGYGSIGRQAARVFAALGATIHAYTASPRTTPSSRKDNGYYVPGTGDPEGTIPTSWYSGTSKTSLHNFLGSGLDALIVALPLTPSTRHIFGADEFNLLGSSGGSHKSKTTGGANKPFLINIARGPILDQPALVDALNKGVLGGAALDVTDPEPLPKDDPLWSAKNVIVTPHVSALGKEYIDRAFDLFVTNWKRHEKGERMFNVVDRKKGY
ncbi:uncharacterized protein PV06_01268 [Exophiala oligosperma]|uniref:D-isomer specific 2-hydroxyacid dehydrogenase NAD-binding domain-containing protein n=2 Tax=Chaetothyriales TaxID=34395 RepID=A0A0D2B919_9EURO|nr:uncharacterized protein PV06_01268 [Exophiala oligosperma]KAJ9628289.1 hypothetical protein H2204_009406 [Knufia peltigerae]KIW48701.1 hypothetical protein PV06_01268 [Exophiala oligosperma]